jgi:hypothetical protein
MAMTRAKWSKDSAAWRTSSTPRGSAAGIVRSVEVGAEGMRGDRA